MEKILPRAVSFINLDNIINNVNVYKSNFKKGVKFCAIVKSDAYGHGSVEVSKSIENITDYFAVATPEEALELRENRIKKPILILGYVPKYQIRKLCEKDIDIPIHDNKSMEDILDVATNQKIKPKVQIKLDTGMSRIGFTKYNYIEELKKIKNQSNLEIRGIFTHFSKADEENQDFTKAQFKLFNEMIENLENMGFEFPIKHISNSSAGLKKEYNLDMVRVGIGLYGYTPFAIRESEKDITSKLKPCMSLITPTYQVKKVPKGTMVGYGGSYKTQKDEWIVTLPIGYADGIHRSVSNKGLKIEFETGDVGVEVGKVCMDQMMVRVENEIKPMTKAYIFSDNKKYTAQYFADLSGTIVYDILSNIRRRVPRWYIKNGEIIKKVSYI